MNSSKVLILLIGLPSLTFGQICTDIEDETKRLACYDERNHSSSAAAEEQQTQPAIAETPAPAPTAETAGPAAIAETPTPEPVQSATVAAEAPEEFGKKEPLDAAREFIEGSIVEIATSANIDYIRLDNGQVWREVEDSHLRFKEGRTVTITEGVMGSYDLQMEGNKKVVKVKRVR